MTNALEGTLTGLSRIALASAPPALKAVFMLNFDETRGAQIDFAHHNIVCPASVERSALRRRSEYLAGRRAARAALRECGIEAADVEIGDNRGPVWPEGYVGSITHSGTIAAAAVALKRHANGVGIDIEHIATPDSMTAIRAVVIDCKERLHLHSLALYHDWATALTIAYSAKESFYKATSEAVGRFFDFSAVRIVSCLPEKRLIELETQKDIISTFPLRHRFRVGYDLFAQGFVLTSCVW